MKKLRTVVAAVTILAGAEALAHGRLADVSVYDRSEGRWLPVYRHEGRMYVVGRRPDSYAARTGRPHDVGVIGVALFRRKQEPSSVAPIAPEAAGRRAEQDARDAPLGTGHGRHEHSPRPFPGFVPDPRS